VGAAVLFAVAGFMMNLVKVSFQVAYRRKTLCGMLAPGNLAFERLVVFSQVLANN
jgi:hypothetical protein